jgi:hypothetical protein
VERRWPHQASTSCTCVFFQRRAGMDRACGPRCSSQRRGFFLLFLYLQAPMKYVDREEPYRPNRPVSFNPGRKPERRLGLLCFLPCTFRRFLFLRVPQQGDRHQKIPVSVDGPINTSRGADNCGRKLQFAVSTLEPRFSCSSHRGWVVHAHYNMQSRAANGRHHHHQLQLLRQSNDYG